MLFRNNYSLPSFLGPNLCNPSDMTLAPKTIVTNHPVFLTESILKMQYFLCYKWKKNPRQIKFGYPNSHLTPNYQQIQFVSTSNFSIFIITNLLQAPNVCYLFQIRNQTLKANIDLKYISPQYYYFYQCQLSAKCRLKSL